MRASKFSEAQVAAILRERAAGVRVAELCRKHGISVATYYKWRTRYGNLDPPGIGRLKRLEHENIILRQLLADVLAENVGFQSTKAGKTET